jgi:hypothetical protein
MKVYFLSSEPCALTLNDVYFSVTDSFERFIEVCPKDNIYARFSPQGKLPIGFFITENLRFSPPDGCDVYLLKDGIAVYAHDFYSADPSMHLITQKRQGDTLVTVFQQGRIQVSIQTAENFFIAYLPPAFDHCQIYFYQDLCLLEGQNIFALYTKSGECLLQEHFLTYFVENNTLNATLPLSDSQNRVVDCAWNLDKNTCTRVRFCIRFAKDETAPNAPPEDLLAYTFFEGLLLGADVSALVCEALQNNIPQIRAFLGDFQGVILTNQPHVCGLIKKKAERLFSVCYYEITCENGKITDVKG